MAEPESAVRQRKTNASTEKDETPASKPARPERASKVDDEDAYSPWLDIFRVLTFLCLASCGLSYLISSGESWVWGMKHLPDQLRIDWWKSQFVRVSLPPLCPLLPFLSLLLRLRKLMI